MSYDAQSQCCQKKEKSFTFKTRDGFEYEKNDDAVSLACEMKRPMFECELGASNAKQIPFSLVCNGRADCVDQSDEQFCK